MMEVGEIKAIAAMGMDVQRLKLKVAGLNIANAGATLSPGAQTKTYSVSFSSQLQNIHQLSAGEIASMKTAVIQETADQPTRVYSPEDPGADEQGYILKSSIDTTQEMINSVEATRAYEANLRIYNSALSLEKSALQIGNTN